MHYFSGLRKPCRGLKNYLTTIKKFHREIIFFWHEKNSFHLPKNTPFLPFFCPFLISGHYFLLTKPSKPCTKSAICATFSSGIHFHDSTTLVREFQIFTFVYNSTATILLSHVITSQPNEVEFRAKQGKRELNLFTGKEHLFHGFLLSLHQSLSIYYK